MSDVVNTGSVDVDDDPMAGTEVPLSRVRRAVAKAMTASAVVPQFAIDRDIKMQRLLEFRATLPKAISTADLLHAAIARAVVEHPRVNASWQDGKIFEFVHVNLGVAIAVPDGLIVPAIERAELLSLAELSSARKVLSQAATAGTLHPRQLGTATISVSNIGPTKATGIRPMVIPPQAAIIGLPAPRANGETTVTISCDHRVIDGLPAAQFLATLAASIEDPGWLQAIAD